MYCATVFWRRRMHYSIVKNHASSLDVADEVYVHLPSGVLHGSRTVNRLITWAWTPPRAFPMRGVTTQVSATKNSTTYTTALKKNLETRGAAPSLLRIRVILLQTALARDKLFTTSGQS